MEASMERKDLERYLSVAEVYQRQLLPFRSLAGVYKMIRDHHLPAVKLGGRLCIPESTFERLRDQAFANVADASSKSD
jgi:excisionase family DNA binding protein